MNNLHRLSEDQLEDRLDELFELGLEDGEEYRTIDKLLNEKAERLVAAQQRAQAQTKLNEERQWQADIENRISEHKRRVEAKYGNYDSWFKWAMSQYTISDEYKVVSTACEWKEEMSWQCSCKPEALEKIEQLLKYKEYDHFVRER